MMPTTISTTSINPPAGGNRQRVAAWSIVEPPASRVVSPSLLRSHSRIDADATASGVSDDYLGMLIDAATTAAEDSMQTSLVPRTMQATFYDGQPIDLPRGPVISITRITDANDAEVTEYQLVNIGNITRIKLKCDTAYPVTAIYRAGYPSAVPADTSLAILTHAASMYENRESISDRTKVPVPHALEMFYCAKRRDTGVA